MMKVAPQPPFRMFLLLVLSLALGACALDFPRPTRGVAAPGSSRAESSSAATTPIDAPSAARMDLPNTGIGGASAAEPGVIAASTPAGTPSNMAAGDASNTPAPLIPAAAGSGGMVAPATPPVARPEVAPDATPDPQLPSTPGNIAPTGPASFALEPIGFRNTSRGLALPLTSLQPLNVSPAFQWTGVPTAAKSLALVCRDLDLERVRWIVWNIPPVTAGLPAGLEPWLRPDAVPGSLQMGVGGATGYSGPVVPEGTSEFTLWALDVDSIPDAVLRGPNRLADTLNQYRVASTEPLRVSNALQ